ncbi:probable plastidic glucose transporter 2 isoform X3 [Magnolia sinica]|uniref:probable plastidic glucose transporter 2 isoform X3 n=1 Tax=Magnolia sinica TaxID=86752 RepID=UPI00265AE192|nr:probable plastidic glucose transporter 2 isoform X3 [Magnolia sinica]
MWGRPILRDSSSMHKRLSSREGMDLLDREGNSERSQNGMGQEGTQPSSRLSLPHVCVATISSFLFGYHTGVVNEPLESIALDLGFGGNTLAEGLVVSICLGGAFVGCLLSGWISDGIGRRRAFQLSALPMIIGASLSATTKNLEGMLLGRLFVGIGMGLGPPVASLYVTEVSPSFVRGTYGSFIQIATCLGIIGALFIGILTKEILGWWRVCFWVSAIPAAILAVGMEFCAESPHWLYKQGKCVEAEAEFERLLGGSHVKSAMAELYRSDRGDDMESVRFSDLIYGRNFRGSFVAMLLMDKLGRRVLLLGSFMGMAVSMGLQVTAATLHNQASEALYLSVGGMLLFVLTFALGAGPVPGLLLPEIFPSRIRAKAMAICMCVHWVVNFFVGLLFLRLLEQLGPQILYSIFSSFCLMAVFFVKRNIVETKGKSLQEIEIALLPSE